MCRGLFNLINKYKEIQSSRNLQLRQLVSKYIEFSHVWWPIQDAGPWQMHSNPNTVSFFEINGASDLQALENIWDKITQSYANQDIPTDLQDAHKAKVESLVQLTSSAECIGFVILAIDRLFCVCFRCCWFLLFCEGEKSSLYGIAVKYYSRKWIDKLITLKNQCWFLLIN